MYVSKIAPDTWPDAMQPVRATPAGRTPIRLPGAAPSVAWRLSTWLELLVLVAMSSVVSLLLAIIAAGAV